MRETFKKALIFTLTWEGYKSEDPDDIGGRTIFGISERSHPEEVAKMWDMPRIQAMDIAGKIYLEKYWIPVGCDDIEYSMDIIAFDTAVNQGVAVAKRFLKEATSPEDYLFKRIARYCDVSHPKYLKGLINRIIALYKTIKRSNI
ncbi:MAG: glycosyl hydrolase 108 family protein [Bacillota bacterium]